MTNRCSTFGPRSIGPFIVRPMLTQFLLMDFRRGHHSFIVFYRLAAPPLTAAVTTSLGQDLKVSEMISHDGSIMHATARIIMLEQGSRYYSIGVGLPEIDLACWISSKSTSNWPTSPTVILWRHSWSTNQKPVQPTTGRCRLRVSPSSPFRVCNPESHASFRSRPFRFHQQVILYIRASMLH